MSEQDGLATSPVVERRSRIVRLLGAVGRYVVDPASLRWLAWRLGASLLRGAVPMLGFLVLVASFADVIGFDAEAVVEVRGGQLRDAQCNGARVLLFCIGLGAVAKGAAVFLLVIVVAYFTQRSVWTAISGYRRASRSMPARLIGSSRGQPGVGLLEVLEAGRDRGSLDLARRRVAEALLYGGGAMPYSELQNAADLGFSKKAGFERGHEILAQRALRVAEDAKNERTYPLVARWASPDAVRQLRSFADESSGLLERFSAIGATNHLRSAYAILVSRATGAPVLVDALTGRAEVASGVLVWSAGKFREADGRYHDTAPDLSEIPEQEVGDYDGLVLDIHELGVFQHRSQQGTPIVVSAVETSYGRTENGAAKGCKKIPLCHATAGVSFNDEGQRVRKLPTDRLSLLSASVLVIDRDGNGVFVERSSAMRHGKNLLGPTAGGVIEINDRGDLDQHGMPDPRLGVLRELREEIGIGIAPTHCVPVAVILSNLRTGDGACAVCEDLPEPPTRTGEGHLVVEILFLAQSNLPYREIKEQARVGADAATGQFEVGQLKPIDLGLGSIEPTCEGYRTVVARVQRVFDVLDREASNRTISQQALTLALYALRLKTRAIAFRCACVNPECRFRGDDLKAEVVLDALRGRLECQGQSSDEYLSGLFNIPLAFNPGDLAAWMQLR